MPGGEVLNRYWDENETPRPESLREDVELSNHSDQDPAVLYRHLRAGAESGWDYSSRWFKSPDSFASIYTSDIVPVDLNCLLFHLEQTIAEANRLNGNNDLSEKYQSLALKRKEAIQSISGIRNRDSILIMICRQNTQKQSLTLAGVLPLFVKIAHQNEAVMVGAVIKEKFLRPGGLVTTLETDRSAMGFAEWMGTITMDGDHRTGKLWADGSCEDNRQKLDSIECRRIQTHGKAHGKI